MHINLHTDICINENVFILQKSFNALISLDYFSNDDNLDKCRTIDIYTYL